MINVRLLRLAVMTVLLLLATVTQGVPARPGTWRVLTLDDGTEVRAQLVGDERTHYWQTADGRCFTGTDGYYTEVQPQTLARRRAQHEQARLARQREKGSHIVHTYTGHRKGIAILVDFPDCRFAKGHDQAYYQEVFNTPGFSSDEGYKGSVYDYFLDQSYGQFHLTFDVTGPVTMPEKYAYYGRDSKTDADDIDQLLGTLIVTACRETLDTLDLSAYDWNGDGEVDQILIIYAGKGQADGGSENTIWPQEWELSQTNYKKRLKMNNYYINTYSCTSELSGRGVAAGIGTMCHEYSHCLGLPDLYDVYYGGNYGMKRWSLMDSGSYNGNGFVPAGYSAFERMSCGWLTPTPLVADTVVTDIQPLVLTPEAYIISNEACPDEFYLLENRQPISWDAGLPGRGMLIFHVDYDEEVWKNNEVNSTAKGTETGNDHQRCTIFLADNRTTSQSRDAYPSEGNDSLTANSAPAAMWYNAYADSSHKARIAITDITLQKDSLMSFRFQTVKSTPQHLIPNRIPPTPNTHHPSPNIYTLEGQYMGTDLSRLPRGVYISNRKIIIKKE